MKHHRHIKHPNAPEIFMERGERVVIGIKGETFEVLKWGDWDGPRDSWGGWYRHGGRYIHYRIPFKGRGFWRASPECTAPEMALKLWATKRGHYRNELALEREWAEATR